MKHSQAFEQLYHAHTNMSIEDIEAARLSNGSYSLPKLSTAYHWWLSGRVDGILSRIDMNTMEFKKEKTQ